MGHTTTRNEPARLVAHDPSWAARFREEAHLLQATIGPGLDAPTPIASD